MPSPSQRRARFVTAGVASLLAVAACERKSQPERVDSVIPAPPLPDAPPPPAPVATSTWDAQAGLALVVPGEQGDVRLVVPGTGAGAPADTAAGAADAVLPGEVLLVSRVGVAGRARAEPVAAAPTGSACGSWPAARLGPASGADAVPQWTVGLVQPAGGATPVAALPLDSLHGLSPADSASLAAAVTRLASELPADSASRALRGLPFVVRTAGRFRPDSTAETVVAVLTRALAQEASPIGEVILLVAERPLDLRTGRWATAYHERAVGREEVLPAAEVLAALRIGEPGRPALVVARVGEDGSRYSLLERAAPGRWQVRWTSVARGC
ncbi:hypothetical protein [Roseisolibacter agri]|uniref:Lipoprotein n=1 Tax=Roseisolibacter agri TaxID=2014610 RepID=A0AA37Q7R7_9BACT|nr:hypothetical protein [Roseisolibacter agri]GLC24556.1 hypothetical protein rosag_10690 [Roseisolibacter agri]